MALNRVILIGRLTGSPDVRYSNVNGDQLAIAKYTLAVDRKKNGETDFIRCIAFGKQGEFAEKYLNKGMKIGVEGRIQTGSYEDKDGKKVYTTDVVVEAHEFCEKKGGENQPVKKDDEYMNIPDGINDDLPFKG